MTRVLMVIVDEVHCISQWGGTSGLLMQSWRSYCQLQLVPLDILMLDMPKSVEVEKGHKNLFSRKLVLSSFESESLGLS